MSKKLTMRAATHAVRVIAENIKTIENNGDMLAEVRAILDEAENRRISKAVARRDRVGIMAKYLLPNAAITTEGGNGHADTASAESGMAQHAEP